MLARALYETDLTDAENALLYLERNWLPVAAAATRLPQVEHRAVPLR